MKILRFTASWCQPCKAISRAIDSLVTSGDINNDIFETVDIDDNFEKAQEYKVRGVPTLIAIDSDNNVISQHVGAMTSGQLKEWVSNLK